MRWLGVYFDFRLLFKEYTSKMVNKRRKSISKLNMLANIIHDVEPMIMRKANHA